MDSSQKRDPNFNNAPEGYGMSENDLRFLDRLVSKMIQGRLTAGHHPEDILLAAWDFYDNAVRALVDGRYPEDRSMTEKQSLGLEEIKKEEYLMLEYLLNDQEEYIAKLESACAPSKLAKIKQNKE